uniref:NADH-ubiquinone oxidoreductase chain 1 n=1 Tax=Parapsyche difformis TaxID=2904886 RepID=A0A9E8LPT0_9NEOP|nr:NADH dehydrogenase subunit 1 [Parapsyche difformis]UZZ43687.1 NADH dehydrogenase subunit 1 [Parapsyche difformis]
MMWLDFIMMLVSSLVLVISVLVSVAFLTLLERKVLGFIQFRKGPNKLSFMGVTQPFSDAIKLFSKEFFSPLVSNFIVYLLSPVISLFISLLVWISLPYLVGSSFFFLGLLFILCCLSVGVYMIMLSGWSSNSNYSMLGGLRAIAQTISYEVSLIIMMLSVIGLVFDFNLMSLIQFQKYMWFGLMLIPLSLIFLSSMLAECNRTPFDFSEGESELVSGFNIEYGGSEFALLFLSEYASILFMSSVFTLFFLGGDLESISFSVKLVSVAFVFIWVRGTLPRYRYDKLMYLTWKIFLTTSLSLLLGIMSMAVLINN